MAQDTPQDAGDAGGGLGGDDMAALLGEINQFLRTMPRQDQAAASATLTRLGQANLALGYAVGAFHAGLGHAGRFLPNGPDQGAALLLTRAFIEALVSRMAAPSAAPQGDR